MTLEHHTSFASLRDDWDELSQRVDAPPFLRAGWCEAWWRAFGSGALDIFALRSDGRLAAVLPLSRRRGVIRSLANWHQPEFGSVAQDVAAKHALTEELLRSSRLPIALRLVDGGGADIEALRAVARTTHGRLQTRVQQRSPYLDLQGDFAAYLARLDSRFRGNLRRRRRRLAEQGDVVTGISDRWDRLDEALADFYRLEASTWKAGAGTAIASDPGTLSFYTEVARWAAENGWLRLAFLTVGDQSIAGKLLLEHGDVMYDIKGGFDTSYATFGPGKLLRSDVVSHCFSRGLRRLDLLGAASADKLHWTETSRDMTAIDFFPRSAAGAVGMVSYRYGRPMAKRARAYVTRDDEPWRRLGARRGAPG